eukprot:1945969-Prymnesium_polylepis.1
MSVRAFAASELALGLGTAAAVAQSGRGPRYGTTTGPASVTLLALDVALLLPQLERSASAPTPEPPEPFHRRLRERLLGINAVKTVTGFNKLRALPPA